MIKLNNHYLKFAAAHFTIFSATERERLHGHNFMVSAKIRARVIENGLCFDYNIMKKRLRTLCEQLDEYTLLPGQSRYLTMTETDIGLQLKFNSETFYLPADDCLVLPVANITAEELSRHLLEKMLEDHVAERYGITALSIAVASGPGQSAATEWTQKGGVL
ncbi:MAG: 6-pyruvoyl tetrahydropterin synthase family protein [Woeseiaceae bacterium]